MINASGLLGALLQSGMTRSAGSRIEHAVGPDGAGGAMGGLLSKLRSGNPAAVGGIGALAGAVLGGSKVGALRGAVGGGALALLGSLAFDALRKAGAAAAASQPGPSVPRTAGGPVPEPAAEGHAHVLLQAMINAAKADGNLDGAEMERIMTRLDELGEDKEARDFVLGELRRPFDLEALAAQVRTVELAAEVYAASLLAIEVDTPAEQDYLRDLARRLKLPPAAVGQMHAQLGIEQQA